VAFSGDLLVLEDCTLRASSAACLRYSPGAGSLCNNNPTDGGGDREIDAQSASARRCRVFSGVVPAGGGTVPLPLAPDFGGAFTVVGVTLDLGNAKWLSFSPRGAY